MKITNEPLFLVFRMEHHCGREDTQQNRSEHPKCIFVKAKHEIEHIIVDMEPIPTDIIPLINKAWLISFSELESNKNSIA